MATTTYRHPRGAYPAGRTDRAIAALWSPERARAVLLLGFALLGLTIGAQAVLWADRAGSRRANCSGADGVVAGGTLAAVYMSFVVSPPLIGWVAEFGSLQVALAILGISGAATVWLTTMCVLTMREVPE